MVSYEHMRKPVSVTLEEANLLWLRAQAAATPKGSVSEVLDRIVQDARLAGRPDTMRSVVGTIDVPPGGLEQGDKYVRALFDRSLRRPMLVKESAPPYRGTPRGRKTRRG